MKGIGNSHNTERVSSRENSGRPDDQPYTVPEIADWFDVDPTTIHREIKRGRLRALKVGRIYRVLPTDFADYVARSATTQCIGARELEAQPA